MTSKCHSKCFVSVHHGNRLLVYCAIMAKFGVDINITVIHYYVRACTVASRQAGSLRLTCTRSMQLHLCGQLISPYTAHQNRPQTYGLLLYRSCHAEWSANMKIQTQTGFVTRHQNTQLPRFLFCYRALLQWHCKSVCLSDIDDLLLYRFTQAYFENNLTAFQLRIPCRHSKYYTACCNRTHLRTVSCQKQSF